MACLLIIDRMACRYGFMPHRIALLIYWQAVCLACKGVPLHAPFKAHAEPKVGALAGEKKRRGQGRVDICCKLYTEINRMLRVQTLFD